MQVARDGAKRLGASGDARRGRFGRSCRCRSRTGGSGSQVTWREAVGYLPVAIPLALATVVGGIDCTESAAAAGDDYPTGQIIAVEGFATLFGGLFGGVIQSTPYIGHPAYKAMGARAAYTLATALFVGAAGIFGFFDWIFFVIPKPVIFPILIFIGLEITSQSFHATPVRHYPGGGDGVRPRAGVPGLAGAEPAPPADRQAVRGTASLDSAVDSDRHGPGRRRHVHRDERALGHGPRPPDRWPDSSRGRDPPPGRRLFLVRHHPFAACPPVRSWRRRT